MTKNLYYIVLSFFEKKFISSLILTFSLIILESLCIISLPIILKSVIDILIIQKSFNSIVFLFISYIVLLLSERIFSELQFISYSLWENSLIRNGYNKIFISLFNKPDYFFKNRLAGSITNNIFQAFTGIESLIFDFTFKILPIFFQLAFILISVSYFLSFKISLTFFAGCCTYTLLVYKFNQIILGSLNGLRNIKIETQGKLTDFVQAWKDIKITSGHKFIQNRLGEYTKSIFENSINFYKKRALLGFIQSMPIIGLYGIVNYQLITSYIVGLTSISSIILVNSYLYQVTRPLEVIGLLIRGTMKSISDASTISDFISLEIVDQITSNSSIKGDKIVVKNLYIEGVLNGLSLELNRGDKIAIVGESGSGKSTFLNVLSGFEKNYTGEIFIDSVNIKNISHDNLLSNINYFPSNSRLIHESIFNNVSMGNADDKVISSLRSAGILEKINRLQNNIDTIIAENKGILSAGEIQRIKLARHLNLTRNISLYDESTSALHPELEKQILNEILNNQNQIVIFITHKYSFLDHFNKVFMMKNGVLEQVNYKDIFQTSG